MVVRTIVVDTNYFRSMKPPELDLLRARGFVLRVSASAFTETWARAVKDEKPGIVYTPARTFDPYVSKDFPIAESGSALIRSLGGVPPTRSAFNAFRDASEHPRNLRRIWRDLITEQGQTQWWERSGKYLAAQIDEHAAHWLDLARAWREKRPEDSEERHAKTLRQIEEVGEEKLIRGIFPYILQVLGNPRLTPPLRERMNAYIRVFALRLGETGRGAETATANDAEDLVQLQHVGVPAFFMTDDADILFDVGRARTFQAPWVRRFIELAEDPLPDGVPWGPSAINISRELPARSKRELTALAKREREAVEALRSARRATPPA